MTVSKEKRSTDLAARILGICNDAKETPSVVIAAIVLACAAAMRAANFHREMVDRLLDELLDSTSTTDRTVA